MSRAASAGAPAPQPDLFGPALLPGLTYADEIIGAAEEAEAIRQIEAAGLTPFQFQQWEGKRLTRSFGWTYDFQTGRFARGEAIPAWIEPFRTRAAEFARLDADALEQVLLIDYGVGAGIGWHRDRPVFEAGGFDRASADLAPRSIYHMQGEVRNDWEHSIAPMPGRRWSITFRSLKPAFHQS